MVFEDHFMFGASQIIVAVASEQPCSRSVPLRGKQKLLLWFQVAEWIHMSD